MAKIIWIILYSLFISTISYAASFDCGKDATPIETIICSSDKLSELDDVLAVLYKGALEESSDKQKIIEKQKQWLKLTRNVCQNAECATNTYQARQQEFIDALLDRRLNLKSENIPSTTECPVNHIKELPAGVSKTLSIYVGVETYIVINRDRQPAGIALVTAPLSNFQCDNKHENFENSLKKRQLSFWTTNSNGWFNVDETNAGDKSPMWPLDTFGNVLVRIIADNDTDFRLVQMSWLARTSFGDILSFKFKKDGKFEIIKWTSYSNYEGMYGGGPWDTDENFEALKQKNPNISSFDGYQREVDYVGRSGWAVEYKFEKNPVSRQIKDIKQPESLNKLINSFDKK